MTGEGTWSQKGTAVFIETDNWNYIGQIKGEKINGRRTPKAGNEASVEWEIDLSNKPSGGASLLGQWEGKYGDGSNIQIDIQTDGSWDIVGGTWTEAGKYSPKATGPNTFELDTRKFNGLGTVFDMTISGDTMKVKMYNDGRSSNYTRTYGPLTASLKKR